MQRPPSFPVPQSRPRASSDPLYNFRVHLFTQLNQLLDKFEAVRKRESVCSRLVGEHIIVNERFTEFGDMHTELNNRWPQELLTYPPYQDLVEEVKSLSEWMSAYESRVSQAHDTLREMMESLKPKRIILDGYHLDQKILHSQDLSEADSIIRNFDWEVDFSSSPNTDQLEVEWEQSNILAELEKCISEMTQLYNTPEGILVSELEYMTQRSSTSSESNESPEGLGPL